MPKKWYVLGGVVALLLLALGVLVGVVAEDALGSEPAVYMDRERLDKRFVLPPHVRSVRWVALPMHGSSSRVMIPNQDDPLVLYALLEIDERDWAKVQSSLGEPERKATVIREDVIDALKLRFDTADGRPAQGVVDVYTLAPKSGYPVPGQAIKVRGGLLAWKVSG